MGWPGPKRQRKMFFDPASGQWYYEVDKFVRDQATGELVRVNFDPWEIDPRIPAPTPKTPETDPSFSSRFPLTDVSFSEECKRCKGTGVVKEKKRRKIDVGEAVVRGFFAMFTLGLSELIASQGDYEWVEKKCPECDGTGEI